LHAGAVALSNALLPIPADRLHRWHLFSAAQDFQKAAHALQEM
jgi:hypothetical protein